MELIHKPALAILFIYVIGLSFSIAFSQSNEIPCSSPEASQFDFWIGDWKAEWTDSEGKTQTGFNKITKILGGCALEENFSTSDNSFIGKSYSVFNPTKQIWQQTWVDNQGTYMDFTGGMDSDKMILSRRVMNKMGKEVIQRMVFTDIKPNSFTWKWESSADEGKTWNLNWQILYSKR